MIKQYTVFGIIYFSRGNELRKKRKLNDDIKVGQKNLEERSKKDKVIEFLIWIK